MIRWSPEAVERLELIEAHVAADNPTAAARLVTALIARAEQLATHPALGRAVRERGGEGLREVVEGNYRIVYRTMSEAVEVVTVFEGHLPLARARRRRRQ